MRSRVAYLSILNDNLVHDNEAVQAAAADALGECTHTFKHTHAHTHTHAFTPRTR